MQKQSLFSDLNVGGAIRHQHMTIWTVRWHEWPLNAKCKTLWKYLESREAIENVRMRITTKQNGNIYVEHRDWHRNRRAAFVCIHRKKCDSRANNLLLLVLVSCAFYVQFASASANAVVPKPFSLADCDSLVYQIWIIVWTSVCVYIHSAGGL